MNTLTAATPRVHAKRDPCRTHPRLGYRYQSVSMTLKPAVVWHLGNGSLSHARRTAGLERGRRPVSSPIALVEDQRAGSQTTILSISRPGLRQGFILTRRMSGPTQIHFPCLVCSRLFQQTPWMYSYPFPSSIPLTCLMDCYHGSFVCASSASSSKFMRKITRVGFAREGGRRTKHPSTSGWAGIKGYESLCG
jgi:hypothetical protein